MKNKKILMGLSLIFVFFMFFNIVKGLTEPTYRVCLNDSLLYEEKIWTYNGIKYNLTQNTTCSFGCYNNDCYEPYDVPFEIFIAIAFFCATMSIIFAYLTIKMGASGDHILPILFIVLMLLFAMLGIFTITQITVENSLDNISETMVTGLQILVWAFIFIVFYMIVSYVFGILKGLGKLDKVSKKLEQKHKTGEY